jgi:hypothetical protein
MGAHLLGLGAAGIFHKEPKMVGRVRGVAFTFLTPFFFAPRRHVDRAAGGDRGSLMLVA